MRLQLANFRQHKNLEIEIQDSGLVMLSGKSGTGKTTIFDAIAEALYGEFEDIAPWNRSSTPKVILEINNPSYLKIERTRTPNTLTVTDSYGVVYKDDLAQEKINQTIGMSFHEFMACSYIQQGMQGSLLTLTPAEKLKFIQKLSIGLIDPEKIKKGIDNIITNEKNNISHLEEQKQRLESQKQELLLSLDKNKMFLESIILPAKTKDHEEANKHQQLTLKEIEKINAQIKQLNQEIKSNEESNNFLISFDSLSKECMDSILLNQNKIKKIDQEFHSLQKQIELFQTQDLELINKNLEVKDNYFKVMSDIKEYASFFYEKYPNSKKDGINDYIKNELDQIESKILSLMAETDTLQSELKKLSLKQDPLYCPSCNEPLRILNGKIVSYNDVIENIEEKRQDLKQKISSALLAIEAAKNQKNEMERHKNKISLLKQSLPKDPLPEIKTKEEFQIKKQEILNQINTLSELLKKKESITWAREELSNRIKEKGNSLERLKSQKEEILRKSNGRTKDQISFEIDELQNKLLQKNKDMEIYTKLSQEYSEYLRAAAKRGELIKAQEIINSSLDQSQQEISLIQQKIKTSTERFAAATKLRRLNDYASMTAIELIIDQINNNASGYIDKFFPNDGTQVILKNHTITGKGEERAKIGVEIFHKGKNPKKINNLSGGEKSRICLAFQLAVSDLYKSSILLIDEGFVGLDDETKRDCMEILKDVSANKTICVIEHGASEYMFDQIINL